MTQFRTTITIMVIAFAFTVSNCTENNKQPAKQKPATDPLPSWNKGATKTAILDYVKEVTTPGNAKFIDEANRIATFDNDGTLWNEKPLYIHVEAVLARYQEVIKENPALAEKEPYKSIKNKDLGYFAKLYEKNEIMPLVGDLIGVPFEGMTTSEFIEWNKNWLSAWKHPKYKVGYKNLIYQPMVELTKYLQDNGFKVYIVTADEAAFLQPISDGIYGIPSEMVLGSSIVLKYSENGVLTRTAKGKYLDNWDAKPRQIWQIVGKKSIFSAGNSNGDYHMLQWTAKNGGFALMVHHTDGVREDKYNKHTDKVMPMMKEVGGTIVDMKNDWKVIFPTK